MSIVQNSFCQKVLFCIFSFHSIVGNMNQKLLTFSTHFQYSLEMSLEINTKQHKSLSIMTSGNNLENNHTTANIDSPAGNPLTNNDNNPSIVS